MSFLVTQFPAGLEPCAHVVRLALAVNREMEHRGKERYRILVPWLYGERQVHVLRDVCAAEGHGDPSEILLDERLGGILEPFLTNEGGYAVGIAIWVSGWQDASRAVRSHFSGDIGVMDLNGRFETLNTPNIALELHRSSRLHFGMALAYQVTPCPLTRLFQAMEPIRSRFSLGPDLLAAAQKTAAQIERNVCRTFVSVPAFAGLPPLGTALTDRVHVPPLISSNRGEHFYVAPSNESRGTPATAESVWRALLTETPLLLSPFERTDDPEIYFTGERAVELGIASVWKAESELECRDKLEALRPNLRAVNEQIRQRFGTGDGISRAAKEIVDDVLRETRPAYG